MNYFPACLVRRIGAGCAALLLSACANTTFIGHKHAVNFETELKPDMSAPLNMNFGYLSHSAVVVPPKKPLPFAKLPGSNNVHEGDLLSTWSVFKIERTPNQFADFTIRTGVASGDAASHLADPVANPVPATARAHAFSGSVAPSAPTGIGRKMRSILFD